VLFLDVGMIAAAPPASRWFVLGVGYAPPASANDVTANNASDTAVGCEKRPQLGGGRRALYEPDADDADVED
jgi:hypothetical protein